MIPSQQFANSIRLPSERMQYSTQRNFQNYEPNYQLIGEKLQNIVEQQAMSGRIQLQEQYLGDEGAIQLAKILQKYKNIALIDLKGNNIGPKGFVNLFEVIKSNFHLKTLCLEWNKLGGQDLQGLEALYSLLNNNRNITHLDLKNNRISGAGAQIIANIIRNNQVLTSIDLKWNDIGLQGAKAILNALDNNITLVSLELAGNSINEDILNHINQKIIQNRDKSYLKGRRIVVQNADTDQELSTLKQSSLNQRDLVFQSRQGFQDPQMQMMMGSNMPSQQFPAYQTQQMPIYQQQQQPQSSQMRYPLYQSMSQFQQQQLQQSQQSSQYPQMYAQQRVIGGTQPQFARSSTIPYEEDKIIQHLESLVEDERINTITVKEEYKKRLEDKKQQLKLHTQEKDATEARRLDAEQKNKLLKEEMQNLQTDLKEYEDKKKQETSQAEEQAKKFDQKLRDLEKMQGEENIKVNNEHITKLKTVEQEQSSKCDELAQQISQLKSRIDEIRFQIHSEEEAITLSSYNTRQQAKETIEKLELESRRNYKERYGYVQSKLQKFIQDKLHNERQISELIASEVNKNKQDSVSLKEKLISKSQIKVKSDQIKLYNDDIQLIIGRLESDNKMQEELIQQLQSEKDYLASKLEKMETRITASIQSLDTNHKNEMSRVSELHEKQRLRIQELENALKSAQQENYRLGNDYQRLGELLQGNLSKNIYQTFIDQKVV